MISVGFVGFGEAAYNMGCGLKNAGLKDIFAFDVALTENAESQMKKTVISRINESGIFPVDTIHDLASKSTTVVLAVPAQFTKSVAEQILPFLNSTHLLVDVTTASPSLKQHLGGCCTTGKIAFVDSPMLGALKVFQHKVPIIACGSGANRWKEEMTPFGMSIQIIEGEPGMATRIKLVRSVFTKGFEALLVETFMFARKNSLENVVLESLEETMDKETFREAAIRYMSGDLIHASRRVHELQEAVTIMKQDGVEPLLGSGALARLKASAAMGYAEKLGGRVPKSLAEVYSKWDAAEQD